MAHITPIPDPNIATISNRPVPCAHPWAAPTLTNKRDTIKITVSTRHDIRDFDLHVDALRARSRHFHDCLPSFIDKPKHRPSIRLALTSPRLFGIFLTWLYRGTLETLEESKISHLFLCQLYAFANDFGVPLLRDKTLDVVFRRMVGDAPELPYDVMGYMELHLRDSALRDMVLDVMVQCGDKDKWRSRR
jgi:hypothetical protein